MDHIPKDPFIRNMLIKSSFFLAQWFPDFFTYNILELSVLRKGLMWQVFLAYFCISLFKYKSKTTKLISIAFIFMW
jgi:hypothetical protein